MATSRNVPPVLTPQQVVAVVEHVLQRHEGKTLTPQLISELGQEVQSHLPPPATPTPDPPRIIHGFSTPNRRR